MTDNTTAQKSENLRAKKGRELYHFCKSVGRDKYSQDSEEGEHGNGARYSLIA